jgi:hypothetical protein
MRSTFIFMLVLALAGCGDYEARRLVLDGHQPQYLSQLRDLTLAPYREWQKQQPLDCASPQLLEARASVISTSLMIKPEKQGFEATYDAATWILEVADGAAGQGCNAIARELYNKVRSIYTGAGYAGLRDHASAATAHLGS